jgi:hypothetical protein
MIRLLNSGRSDARAAASIDARELVGADRVGSETGG